MKCVHCVEELRPMERMGIEIDYCPKCRGVWLDRGELDKIIDRSQEGANSYAGDRNSRERRRDDSRRHLEDSDYGGHSTAYPRRKESFLSRLFDWD